MVYFIDEMVWFETAVNKTGKSFKGIPVNSISKKFEINDVEDVISKTNNMYNKLVNRAAKDIFKNSKNNKSSIEELSHKLKVVEVGYYVSKHNNKKYPGLMIRFDTVPSMKDIFDMEVGYDYEDGKFRVITTGVTSSK